MQIIRGLDNFHKLNSSVVSIGNFDGVHLAHQKIIQNLICKAQDLNTKAVVISFYPHPSYFFNNKIPLLLSFREKITHLQNLGVDALLLINFNDKFADISATDFINNILINKLNAKYIVVGDDFNFGKNKLGDIKLLQQFIPGKQIDPQIINNKRISSSNIRRYLENSKVKDANTLLGYDYYLSGRVIKGRQLGAKIGFPTANISLKNRKLPISGVWGAKILLDNKTYNGVVNIGFKPTINNLNKSSVEVYIFDFNKNIYTKTIKIYPIFKIRDEKKFNNVEELVKQIKKDIIFAKNKV